MKLTKEKKQKLIKEAREALSQMDVYDTDFKRHPSEFAWKKICEYKEIVDRIKKELGDDAGSVGENLIPPTHP
jgi:hypothetical protein